MYDIDHKYNFFPAILNVVFDIDHYSTEETKENSEWKCISQKKARRY
jgi:hypothetical protein